ncbi:MAG TPA: hypothetical protein VK327_12330 [Candidatus Paceibacterota bacterium]|nr:hypothetical protein [Candidatus Paceibacterota bacterium]
MKTLLKLSLLLNAALCGCLVFLLLNHTARRPIPRIPALVNEEPVLTNAPVAGALTGVAAAGPKPFRWEQLESPDYHVYISNLRQIGCPEPTIRDLITAEIDNLFAPRRVQLTNQLAASPSPLMRLAAEGEMEKQLTALGVEQTVLIDALLGSRNGTSQSASAHPRTARNNSDKAVVSTPLVLQNVESSGVTLNGDQSRAIAEARQNFIDAVGGPNQNPDDPSYREHWLKAQPEADEMLKTAIGINAFQELQAQASGTGQN